MMSVVCAIITSASIPRENSTFKRCLLSAKSMLSVTTISRMTTDDCFSCIESTVLTLIPSNSGPFSDMNLRALWYNPSCAIFVVENTNFVFGRSVEDSVGFCCKESTEYNRTCRNRSILHRRSQIQSGVRLRASTYHVTFSRFRLSVKI